MRIYIYDARARSAVAVCERQRDRSNFATALNGVQRSERRAGNVHVVEKLMATTLCRVAIDTKTYVWIADITRNHTMAKKKKWKQNASNMPKTVATASPFRIKCIFTHFGMVAATISRSSRQ